jgi:hypothetical protein
MQGEGLETSPCVLAYYFFYEPWGACSAACGGGTRSRVLECIHRVDLRPSTSVDDCQDYDGNTIPISTLPPTTGACNTQACPTTLATWSVGPWSDCSAAPSINDRAGVRYPDGTRLTCGGVRSRAVRCVDPTGALLPESACVRDGLPTPATTERCGTCGVCRPFHRLLSSGASWTADSPSTCSGHGVCNGDGRTCDCSTGWSGAACNTPIACAVGSTCLHLGNRTALSTCFLLPYTSASALCTSSHPPPCRCCPTFLSPLPTHR